MTKTLFELPLKSPGDVAYSHAGDLLAVTSEKDVVILDAWRMSVVHLFSGHGGHLSTVNQVAFSPDDQMLLSCASAPNGAIYGWELATDKKEKAFEHVAKGTDYA